MKTAVYVYVINVDWYFDLHWLQRAQAVKNTGVEVHLIMAVTHLAIKNKLEKEGFICHTWQVNRKSIDPVSNFNQLLDLYSLLKAINPSLIHAATIKPNIFVGFLSFWLKIPYILSVTGTGVIFSGKSWRKRILRSIVRMFYKLQKYNKTKHKIIFENTEDNKYFVMSGLCHDNQAVTILGAGIDTEIFKAVAEQHSDTPVILFAGRLVWDKGLGDLVEASHILQQRGLNFTLKVAGIIDELAVDPIDQAVLDSWHQDGLIDWIGMVKDMPKQLSKAHIVVLPSLHEGVPRVLIEASACARPIVASDIAGCREIVQNGVNGLLTPVRNAPALADALSQLLLAPDLRKEMGRNGRNIVESRFANECIIPKTISLYDELLQ